MISNVQIEANQATVGVTPADKRRPSFRRYLATSTNRLPCLVRRAYVAVNHFSVPAPRWIIKPILWLFLGLRECYQFLLRVLICEPLFKGYCKRYGRRLRTDCHLHWVAGKGDITVGDDVWLDGKTSITFAARFADHPLLEIGDRSRIGHNCDFRIGKRISIGRNCNLSGGTIIMDSNGHPADPQTRWDGQGPEPEEVRPVVIGDGVWIGLHCIIFPGVRIGEGSIISAGSVVRTHVPAYSVVAGNPAKIMFRLKKPVPEAIPQQDRQTA
jgi:acetyltransferase-like isoleucine patch superfamily enzyme